MDTAASEISGRRLQQFARRPGVAPRVIFRMLPLATRRVRPDARECTAAIGSMPPGT
jgi:hypothetical protein